MHREPLWNSLDSDTLRGFKSNRMGLHHSGWLFTGLALYCVPELSQCLEQIPLGRATTFQVNTMFREVIFQMCLQHHRENAPAALLLLAVLQTAYLPGLLHHPPHVVVPEELSSGAVGVT